MDNGYITTVTYDSRKDIYTGHMPTVMQLKLLSQLIPQAFICTLGIKFQQKLCPHISGKNGKMVRIGTIENNPPGGGIQVKLGVKNLE